MKLEAPYLLFLGDAKELLSLKVANGVVDWRPELAVGEIGLPECTVTLGLQKLSLAQAKKRGARTFVVGMNNSGGTIAPEWIPTILEALQSGFDIASGLHERLTDIPEIADEARRSGGRLIDVRHSDTKLQTGTGIRRTGKRLLTVGTDCSVGKMYTSLALEKEMRSRGFDADFVATGQSGIFISGSGIAVDCVISDFISGAVEQLSADNDAQHWDVVEGQGSLFHPSFAGVTLGLLHGAQPDALVLCHAENRSHMRGMRSHKLPGFRETMELNLQAARLTNADTRFVGIAVNTSELSASDSQAVLEKYEDEFQLPSVDPVRTGVASVVDRIAGEFPD
jgi:D-glutamate N-acetyltransferase